MTKKFEVSCSVDLAILIVPVHLRESLQIIIREALQ